MFVMETDTDTIGKKLFRTEPREFSGKHFMNE